MKKRRIRVPVLAAAVVAAMGLMLTAAAVGGLFRNDKVVSSMNDIIVPSAEPGAGPGMIAISSPGGGTPPPLEDVAKSRRFKSDDWDTGNSIAGGVLFQYTEWESVDVLSRGPALRIRRVTRGDGAEKMEYTAENPANLLDTLTGRVTFDLGWLDEHYDYVPDANLFFAVTDENGNYVSELFEALYAKPDGSGYVSISMNNVAQEDYWGQSYILKDDYEAAYYYTNPDGLEFLVTMLHGNVSAQCRTSHANFDLNGAYLTRDEIEDILDHLCLTFEG